MSNHTNTNANLGKTNEEVVADLRAQIARMQATIDGMYGTASKVETSVGAFEQASKPSKSWLTRTGQMIMGFFSKIWEAALNAGHSAFDTKSMTTKFTAAMFVSAGFTGYGLWTGTLMVMPVGMFMGAGVLAIGLHFLSMLVAIGMALTGIHLVGGFLVNLMKAQFIWLKSFVFESDSDSESAPLATSVPSDKPGDSGSSAATGPGTVTRAATAKVAVRNVAI